GPSGGVASSGRLRATLWLVAGLAGLALGADTMVQAAVSIARHVGLDEVVIGLTVVAIGTSLPELASTVVAAARGQRDLAVGNVVGSCLFNLLGVLGPAALVAGRAGLEMPPAVQHFDLWVMLAALAACLPIFFTGREVARWEGALFLLYYVAYTAYLLLRAQAHAALPAYSNVMLWFFVPLTVVTLVVAVSRRAAD
ncbi:MAG: sodium:calcium antiporter, partial [Rubrivivax sp.]